MFFQPSVRRGEIPFVTSFLVSALDFKGPTSKAPPDEETCCPPCPDGENTFCLMSFCSTEYLKVRKTYLLPSFRFNLFSAKSQHRQNYFRNVTSFILVVFSTDKSLRSSSKSRHVCIYCLKIPDMLRNLGKVENFGKSREIWYTGCQEFDVPLLTKPYKFIIKTKKTMSLANVTSLNFDTFLNALGHTTNQVVKNIGRDVCPSHFHIFY